MIKLGSYYYINEGDVVAVEMAINGSEKTPYSVRVRLRDGATYGICYADERGRDKMAQKIAEQVERAAGGSEWTLEAIHNKLYLIQDQTSRMDKRQMRIWQQLKALLGVRVEEN